MTNDEIRDNLDHIRARIYAIEIELMRQRQILNQLLGQT